MTDEVTDKNNNIIAISKYFQTDEKRVPKEKDVISEISELIRRHIPEKTEFTVEEQKLIEIESQFKAQFGFSLGKKGRQAFLKLIHRYDFSNEEIKAIKRIGRIDWDGQSLRVSISPFVVLHGLFQISLIVLLISIFFLAFLLAPNPSLEAIILVAVIVSVLGFLGYWTKNLYLSPYNYIQKRLSSQSKKEAFLAKLKRKLNCSLA